MDVDKKLHQASEEREKGDLGKSIEIYDEVISLASNEPATFVHAFLG